ncbi:MAG TPA: sugar phosphate isomerase/epimerase [Gemmatimonadaceae bacterium]|nr:sugar phosphate isomerase/epimerase [Gemmatimonadaceae bacterium]
MIQTRRNFLATLGVAALGVVSRNADAAAATVARRRRIERVGLQLYTVRDLMKADMPGTIARVAEIGYKEVEFAGYFGRTPHEVHELLEKYHLSSPSTHVPYDSFQNWQKVLDDSKVIGHKWVTLPWIPPEKRTTVADWKAIAAQFNQVGAQARKSGLRFAYHNHDFELKAIDGVRPLDILLGETDPKFVDFEMDIYWVIFGGGDPLDYFARYPHRFALAHIKDSAGPPDNKMVDVGQGKIDFRTILAQSDKAGFQHYFVEHDQPADPIATIRNSYNYLHALTF